MEDELALLQVRVYALLFRLRAALCGGLTCEIGMVLVFLEGLGWLSSLMRFRRAWDVFFEGLGCQAAPLDFEAPLCLRELSPFFGRGTCTSAGPGLCFTFQVTSRPMRWANLRDRDVFWRGLVG